VGRPINIGGYQFQKNGELPSDIVIERFNEAVSNGFLSLWEVKDGESSKASPVTVDLEEEARKAAAVEAARKAEEDRLTAEAEQARLVEKARLAEEARLAAEAKQAEAAKKSEEERILAEEEARKMAEAEKKTTKK
jgi:hypothetical protein